MIVAPASCTLSWPPRRISVRTSIGSVADGKADDAERREWFTAHRVDIGQRVGRGDLSEVVRIVDDRREEVDRLHEREIIGQPEHPRVIEGLTTDEDSGIGSRDERRESAGQVTRTQLGGSTRAAGELGQSEGVFPEVSHWIPRFRWEMGDLRSPATPMTAEFRGIRWRSLSHVSLLPSHFLYKEPSPGARPARSRPARHAVVRPPGRWNAPGARLP